VGSLVGTVGCRVGVRLVGFWVGNVGANEGGGVLGEGVITGESVNAGSVEEKGAKVNTAFGLFNLATS